MTATKSTQHRTNQGSEVLHEAKIINAFVRKQPEPHYKVLIAWLDDVCICLCFHNPAWHQAEGQEALAEQMGE